MNDPHQEQKKIGAGMMVGMWVLLLSLMALLFSGILDRQRNPNQNVQSATNTRGQVEVVLQRNRFGHYVTSGQINQQDVVFMLDTGATDVSVPEAVARRLGLEAGRPMTYRTANGRIQVYATRLNEVAIGDIRLTDIRATINPYFEGDDILLGMSFLKHLEFTQRGDTLILRQ